MPHFGGPACAARWQSLVQRRVQLVKSLFIPWPAGMPVLPLRGRPLLHADLFSNGHELWQRPGSPDRRAVEVWVECGAPQARTGPKLGKSIMVYLRRAPSAASDTVPSRSFTPAQRGSPAKHAPGATSVCVVMPNRPIDFAPPGPSQQAFVSFTVTDHLLRLNRL